MDEAKLREDALKAQVLSFEKDNSVLKEQKKCVSHDADARFQETALFSLY